MTGQAGVEPEAAPSGIWARLGQRPFAIWVVFFGLLYFAVGILVLILPLGAILGFGDPMVLPPVIIGVLFFVAAALSLRGKRWTFAFAAVMSVIVILLFSSEIASSLGNPASPGFWFVVSALPGLVLVLVFSALALWKAKSGIEKTPFLASWRSTGGLLTFLVIGFVVGSLVIGSISAGVITRLVQSGGADADIVIVQDAGNPSVATPFSPSPFNVTAGTNVTWVNRDTQTHSVTADDASFDSGLLQPGEAYTLRLATAGLVLYHCAPHPYMKGTVSVS